MRKMCWIVAEVALSGVLFCGCSADVEVDNSKSTEKKKSAQEARGDEKPREPTAEELLEARRDKVKRAIPRRMPHLFTLKNPWPGSRKQTTR